MPLVQRSTSVALSSVNDNLLAGSQWEYMPYAARLSFGLNGDANGADLRVDIYTGQDVILEDTPMNVQNRIPVSPDDFLLHDFVAPGERVKIRVRNTSAAAARTIFWAVIITPI